MALDSSTVTTVNGEVILELPAAAGAELHASILLAIVMATSVDAFRIRVGPKVKR